MLGLLYRATCIHYLCPLLLPLVHRQYDTKVKVMGLGISRRLTLALASSIIQDMFPISLNFGRP